MALRALVSTLVLLGLERSRADHPCQAEVASACPDRPGSELAACLKDSEQHDNPTTISSECTDYIAIHTACAESIDSHCEEAHFTDDTILCLTQWTSPSSLVETCRNVLKWAVPQADDEEGTEDGPTDELGMSEKDYKEKKEWQAKRKAARGDAVGRIKMKEEDRKKEEDRVALEKYKQEDPEGYAQMIEQQEEDKRQQAEFKKRERAQAAALERKKKVEMGIEDADVKPEPSGRSAPSKKKSGSSFLPFLGVLAIVVLGSWAYYAFGSNLVSSSKKAAVRKPKRK